MKKFFTFLLYLFIVVLIAAVVIGVEILLGRPLQEAFIIIGVILASWLLFILVRKAWVRYRAKAQVERVVKRENELVDPQLGKSPKELARDLRRKWHGAIKALRGSHLRMKGDPLYVLPWYMVFGKPASGKSTALKNAKLLSPAMELSEHDDGSTLNLDWWLYDQAIVIDTAGRYAIPDNDKRDKKEWATLLKMLSRHKQKEPLNGLVLVVSAERLLNNTKEQLMEEGQKIRAGVNELMEKLEINMPVYLMVTKCDLVDQFSNWCKYLPEQALNQVMGFLCDDEVTDIDATLDKAFDKILDRLKELRLMMMERSDNPDDSLIELPINLEKLRSGLHAFATTALKSNLYQETPNFRGLYFSSSQQTDETGALANHGIFLHHLFTRVMPPDRGILSTLPNAERIRRAIRNYGLSASGAFIAIVLLLITSAFIADVKPLKTLLSTNESIQLNQSTPRDEIIALYRFSVLINNVEKVEDKWALPWYAFFGPSPHRKQMMELFVNTFRTQILAPMDKSMNLMAGNVSDKNTAYLVSGLVRRINLINARLSKSDEEDAFANAKNIPNEYLSSINSDIGSDASQLFSELYRQYVKDETVTSDLNSEKLALQSSLAKALSSNHGGYDWLIKWANNQDFPNIQLSDFWSGSVTLDNPVKVPAAYTVQGKEFLDGFIKELEEASAESASISAMKNDFMAYYSRNYLKAWKNFAENFDTGMKMLRGKKEWQAALESMTGRDNPYFSLMDEIKNQTEDVTSEGVFPSDENIAYFTEIQDYIGESTSGGKGLSKKQTKKLAKVGLKLLKKFGKVGKSLAKAGKTGMKLTKGSGNKQEAENGENLEDLLKSASQDYKDYKKALKDLSFNSDSTKLSYNSTVSAFTNPDDLSKGDGAGAAAWTAIYKLQKDIGKPDPSSKLFWDLYAGPVRLAYDYMNRQAGCYLEDSWNNDVLAQIAGVGQDKLGETLIGKKGLVWNYVDNTASAFLKKRYLKGYVPTIVNGKSLPWTQDFMSFINHADEGRNIVGNDFTVKISALPTGINQGADIAPYATYLDLHCADGVQSLTNYNYSASTNFKWSLEKCGDTSLRIQVGEITLRKDYPGRKGFSKFLADFRDGRKIFTPDDFPDKASQLRNENVTAIDVNYQITGQEPVIKVLTAVPLTPPDDAIACWSNK